MVGSVVVGFAGVENIVVENVSMECVMWGSVVVGSVVVDNDSMECVM